MARLLRMPEVAANSTEAVLSEWVVQENVGFAAHEVLATVETDKAVVDVEAEDGGVVLRTLVSPGTRVEVGAPIAVLGDPGEVVADLAALLADLGVAEPVDPVVAVRREVPDTALVSDPEGGTAVTGRLARTPGARVFASPLARRLAKEAGLPVDEIDGTGPRNRILRRDVELAIAGRAAPAAGVTSVATTAEVNASSPRTSYQDLPHSRIRRVTAARLAESKQSAPHFYLRATLRADRLLALRAELNEGATNPVSLNDLLLKAAAAAHVQVPEMNVVWTPDAVRRFHAVDLAVAVDTERGLLTPVVRDVASLSVTTLAAQVRDLVDRARSGGLRQEELEGGAMSVTNLGMFGTEEFTAIINPPHAAVLAVGAVREEPVVEDGVLAVGRVLRVTLSVDHRPVDGAVAARWMNAFSGLVEHPVRILA